MAAEGQRSYANLKHQTGFPQGLENRENMENEFGQESQRKSQGIGLPSEVRERSGNF